MFYYKTTGKMTGKEYYFASKSNNETAATNCFPIAESTEELTPCDNPFEQGASAVFLLNEDDGSGLRYGMPCVNEDMITSLNSEHFKDHRVLEEIQKIHTDTATVLDILKKKLNMEE